MKLGRSGCVLICLMSEIFFLFLFFANWPASNSLYFIWKAYVWSLLMFSLKLYINKTTNNLLSWSPTLGLWPSQILTNYIYIYHTQMYMCGCGGCAYMHIYHQLYLLIFLLIIYKNILLKTFYGWSNENRSTGVNVLTCHLPKCKYILSMYGKTDMFWIITENKLRILEEIKNMKHKSL